jgi:DNA-binding transcriptional LysR family regulator
MELDPRRLRVLRAVALRGGVTDAARLLNLTPSAVSQQLALLESEAGVALIDRSQRRVALTAAGQTLAKRAEAIEQELAEAKRELAALSGRVSGPVTIAGFSTAIRYLLVPTFRRLTRTHPGLKPHVIEEVDEAKALRELRTGGVDLVLTEREDHHPEPQYHDLRIHPLADDDYRILVPAPWLPTLGAARDLAPLPWIAGPPESGCGQALKRLAEKYQFSPRIEHVCIEFPAMLTLVGAGMGAAILPTLALPGIDPALVAVSPIPSHCSRRVSAVFRAPRFSPEPTVATLVAELDEAAAEMGFSIRALE